MQVEGNPCLAYTKLVVFPWFGKLSISRKEEAGGEKCARWVAAAAHTHCSAASCYV